MWRDVIIDNRMGMWIRKKEVEVKKGLVDLIVFFFSSKRPPSKFAFVFWGRGRCLKEGLEIWGQKKKADWEVFEEFGEIKHSKIDVSWFVLWGKGLSPRKISETVPDFFFCPPPPLEFF